MIIDEMVKLGQTYNKKFNVKKKSDSAFMKFVGVLFWIFNRRFMTNFYTTIGATVYTPKVADNHPPDWIAGILAHEIIHVRQGKGKMGLMFLKYFFPQHLTLLAVFSLLAIWFSNWFLLFLLFLIFLAPWPARWRAEMELEAYTMDMFIYRLRGGKLLSGDKEFLNNLKKKFTGSGYYFMSWNGKRIANKLEREAIKVVTGAYDNEPIFKEVKKIYDDQKV